MARLVLFEDRHWRSLRPLTDLLPVPALAFGASDVARRWLRAAGMRLFAIEARPVAMAAWHDAPVPDTSSVDASEDALVVNAAALPGAWAMPLLAEGGPQLLMCEGRVAGARLPMRLAWPALGKGERFEENLLSLGLPVAEAEAGFLTWPWDLMERNARAIADDLAGARGGVRGEVHRLACLESPERIVVGEGAVVGPFALLDADAGPILVGRGARIGAHSRVIGPCVIGPGTQVLGGSVSGSTFGPQCRVAGEIEASVWQGYGNKRHHGFVGHSVLGEWVNLGALTTTSDLKNNYGSVRVWVDGAERDTHSGKVGAFVGAHVKTGIGTLLPTGASIGTGSNLFGGGVFTPKQLASFAWWDGRGAVEHAFDRFLATARIAFARRERQLGPADEDALRTLFDSTAAERRPMA